MLLLSVPNLVGILRALNSFGQGKAGVNRLGEAEEQGLIAHVCAAP